MRETPGPIPNPEVKPYSVDGTARVTLGESRTMPDFFYKKGAYSNVSALFYFSEMNANGYFLMGEKMTDNNERPGRPSSGRPSSGRPGRGGREDRAGATRNVSDGRSVSDPRGFRPTPVDRDPSRVWRGAPARLDDPPRAGKSSRRRALFGPDGRDEAGRGGRLFLSSIVILQSLFAK